MDVVAYINMFKSIIRGGVLLLLFSLLKPTLTLMGIASLTIMGFEAVAFVGVKRKIMPELKVNLKDYNVRLLKDILSAGGWNALNNVNGILTMGLDLLFANIFLGATAAGVLALARTIPNYFETLMELIKNSFVPALTKGYAQDEVSLTENMKMSFSVLSLMSAVIIGGVISLGEVFYQLLVPMENSRILQALTIVMLSVEFTYSGVRTIPMVFQITNNLKKQALSSFGMASLSIALVIILLKTTNIGLFVIAGVTPILTTLLRLLYLYPLAAKYIKQKWQIFYPDVLKVLAGIALATGIGFLIKAVIPIWSWMLFISAVLLTASVAFIINLYILISKDHRRKLYAKLRNVLRFSSN